MLRLEINSAPVACSTSNPISKMDLTMLSSSTSSFGGAFGGNGGGNSSTTGTGAGIGSGGAAGSAWVATGGGGKSFPVSGSPFSDLGSTMGGAASLIFDLRTPTVVKASATISLPSNGSLLGVSLAGLLPFVPDKVGGRRLLIE